MKFVLIAAIVIIELAGSVATAQAKDLPYYYRVTLKVGESIILKGVRSKCKATHAPSYSSISAKLPRSKTGGFSNGGKGTVTSNACGGQVPARAIKFTARQKGKETIVIFGDATEITVK